MLADPGRAFFGADGEDGPRLGWVHVCSRRLLIDPPSASGEGPAAALGARRQGVRRALMAAAEDWSRRRGAQTIRLRSGATRADAPALYRAPGYLEGKAAWGFQKGLPPGR